MKINNSNEVIVETFKNFYGIGNFVVRGINSTPEELEEMGFPFKKADYTVNIGGTDWQKLIFYVENEKVGVKTKLEFLVSNRDRLSKGNKPQFINNLGESTWAVDVEEACSRLNSNGVPFFKNINARVAKEGEVPVIEFITAWFNIKNFVSKKEAKEGKKPDEVFLDWSKVSKGDVSELKGYWTTAKNNEVKLMLIIKNGYMNVYNQYFDRASAGLNNFIKYVNKQNEGEYGIQDEYFLGDLKEYVPGESTIQPDAEAPKDVF